MAANVLESGPIRLDTILYPDECLAAAIDAYKEFLVIQTSATDERTRTVKAIINPPHIQHASRVRKEFLNYLLDLSIQYHIKRST